MTEQQLAQRAMRILTLAGNAKSKLSNTLDLLSNENVNERSINKLLNEAHELLVRAHKVQNEVIKEVESIDYSILLTHAQDTLMNVETIEFMTNKMLSLQKRSES
ncbi:PTS lactose/cellobiose transporter subunit IIA [Lentilactobacillus curieae]|uniref:PTS lactose/cellobiose transporter subunit IIA n=1 Tax=Lentilactobacillus curieae TaxID=1138822 RepID=A0A1S6QJG5_9LACO|nr:PTS lactose/cellobiose transporter subunit IIA [Lentilactobacillus curieae]AQW21745.1 PTS lactose/cellobiose transporter subunit IIA [Lentilactobacillus curieae]